MFEDLPLADSFREEKALEMFALGISPEEYAARYSHLWICFSFDDYRYNNPDLTHWIQKLGDILFRRNAAPSIDSLRERFLTPAEIKEIKEK